MRLDQDDLRSGRRKLSNRSTGGTRAKPHTLLLIPALGRVEIRATRRRLFDLLIPVLVTGIQPDQVLGLKGSSAPQTRRCWIPVTSTGMKVERVRSSARLIYREESEAARKAGHARVQRSASLRFDADVDVALYRVAGWPFPRTSASESCSSRTSPGPSFLCLSQESSQTKSLG